MWARPRENTKKRGFLESCYRFDYALEKYFCPDLNCDTLAVGRDVAFIKL